MLQERVKSVVEELRTVESLRELKAIWCHWECEYPECANDAICMSEVKNAVCKLRKHMLLNVEEVVQTMEVSEEELDALVAQLQAVQAAAKPRVDPPVKPMTRGLRRYQLLKTDVNWSNKPQVHAIMRILEAHMRVGDTLDEVDIVNAMVANESVLATVQGGRRIWDYYKGDHMHGLVAHGNVRKV